MPFAIAVGTGVIVWVLVSGWEQLNPSTAAFVFAFGIGGFSYAVWAAFVSKPRRLDREQRTLEEISQELNQPD